MAEQNLKVSNNIFAVILAGGGGTRLWPASKEKLPKQFLKLNGPITMTQATMKRLLPFVPIENIILVTNEKYADEIKRELPELLEDNIIYEPEKKDTALAMLVGALVARSRNPDAVIVNGACDHIVENIDLFINTMKDAISIASNSENLVAVGIVPTRPDTAFGYIQSGKPITVKGISRKIYEVSSFREKPDYDVAKEYVESKQYYWNANMYVWHVETLIQAFHKYCPDVLKRVQPIINADFISIKQHLPKIYQDFPSISIDYAISEKTDNLLLIPGNFGWNDIGDWKVVYDLQPHDANGNATMPNCSSDEAMFINSRGNLVWNSKKKIALHGLNNLVVVDTGDVIMICKKDETQKIKKVVELLKTQGRLEYL